MKQQQKSGPARHIIGGIAALALGLFYASAGEASSLTLGSRYVESSNATSNFPPAASACNGIGYCYIEFAKVPVGMQLLVTQVSCSLSVSASTPTSLYLGTRNGNGSAAERFSFLVPIIQPSNQPGSTVIANNSVYQIYSQGLRPEIYLGLTGAANTTGFCSIGGELTSAP